MRLQRAGLLMVVLSVGCGSNASYDGPSEAQREDSGQMPDQRSQIVTDAPPPVMALAPQPMADAEERSRGGQGAEFEIVGGIVDGTGSAARSSIATAPTRAPGDASRDGDGRFGSDVVDSKDIRRWFPEAFLWQPLVETNDSGVATVDVIVPDQLTTWRVLGLAHDRRGQQAGTLLTFASTLDLYVDPVTPAWLYSGDTVELPVQLSNTTGVIAFERLTVRSSGALVGDGVADIRIPAFGSIIEPLRVRTRGAGPATVLTNLGTADAAERVVSVLPTGRPVQTRRGGIVADSRVVSIPGPTGADGATEEVSFLVFPGALSVLTAEVERAGSMGVDPASAAYGFALAMHLTEMADATGHAIDDDVLRRLQLSAWQRVVSHSRAPSGGVAADLLTAMADVSGHTLGERLRERLVLSVVGSQRGDGTWARQARAPLQQVLVQTAVAARSLPDDESTARLRASGAMERFSGEVPDAFTAAVMLASGVVEPALRDTLQERVMDGLVQTEQTTTVAVPEGVLNAWGLRPTRAEMLTWTTLALLQLDQPEHTSDLVGELMGGYSASDGFGAGNADAMALDAVVRALPSLDQSVTVSLVVDGEVRATAPLDPSQPLVPALLTLAPDGSDANIELRVSPQVPGLSYVATRRSWVPWSGEESMPGVDVEVTLPEWEVGQDSSLFIDVSAPSGHAVVVEQGLPAGATVDEEALNALVGSSLSVVRVEAHRVVVTTRALGAGEVLRIPIVIRPAFAGQFRTGPMLLSDAARPWSAPVALPPAIWDVEA
jgi:hypothetical protein